MRPGLPVLQVIVLLPSCDNVLCAVLLPPGLPALQIVTKPQSQTNLALPCCKVPDTINTRQKYHSAECWVPSVEVPSLQVVALQLGSGHHHTAVCCAWLPCSSVERQRAQMPRMAFPDKEFVVVASFAEEGQPGGLQTVQPQLAVFEFRVAGSR